MSLNFASCSSFLGPYLDSASSTLLAPHSLIHYFYFGFDLDSAILAPLHSSNRKKFLSLFSCLSRYLLSRYIVLALLTQSFSVQSLLFSFAFTSLSLPIFIISSCPRCYETGSVFFAMYISFRVILLYLLFILILFHIGLALLFFRKERLQLLSLLLPVSPYIYFIYSYQPYFFKLRLSW